ncbi:MAG TPA: metal-dependent transcriptional regulator [Bacillota bacterium]|jgi:DtxR family Mn-dependent transcriptional regulator|nr:metal-dependent transcriptional regulator [Bacillota bacterium]HOL11100.1 metal-dependent transcriptional regulator [Bacillota bacterium]HPO98823.1 metal-dependent transcriptional regulator [Bacillota bacterium]
MTDLIKISPSLEDYLETILDLSVANDKVRVTDLAERMKVAKSSVNQAVKKLNELNMIKHEKYGPLTLTKAGEERAQKIRRRHQILKEFLIEILGVNRDDAEIDACKIEHYLCPDTIEKFVAYLEANLKKD